jgi:hypothetical protein
MSAEQRQLLKTIAPTPTISAPGTPFRISATDLFVRTLIIESANTNVGRIFVGSSFSDLMSGRRHTLYEPGDEISISSSEYGAMNAELNLKEIWLDGSSIGDQAIVSYIEITEKLI